MKTKNFSVLILALALTAAGSVANADPTPSNPTSTSGAGKPSLWKTIARDVAIPAGTTGVAALVGYGLCALIPVPGSAICFYGLTAAGLGGGIAIDGVIHHQQKLANDAQQLQGGSVADDTRDAKSVATRVPTSTPGSPAPLPAANQSPAK